MTSYRPIIGLETHIELNTTSKMFCRCSADYFGAKPNTHVCPVCLGLPGSLPMPNKKALEMAFLAGFALGCKISPFSKFDRKNYFYPDLAKGFQISQYDLPLAKNGKLKLSKEKVIRIRRVHLEEDTGKLIHASVKNSRVTLIDFNRSGVPLMEIVTEPDFESADEVVLYAKKLRQLICYLGISEANMQKGQMRFELNISMGTGRKLPDYKVEVKNINSFRFLRKATLYEIKRQKRLYKIGRKPQQETRGWDQGKGVTFSQRFKEEAQDYRYFPEPDIPPVHFSQKEIASLKKSLPELFWEKEKRFKKHYRLSSFYIKVLTSEKEKADFFEEAVRIGEKYKISASEIANIIVNKRIDLDNLLPGELVKILVKAKKTSKISEKELEKLVLEVLNENQKAVKDFLSGKKGALNFLIGQIARKSRGKFPSEKAHRLLLEKLKK